MTKQTDGARTAVIAIGIMMALCNVGALYMYAFTAAHAYNYPYFSYVARALSPMIGGTHRGEWSVHWGYGEWAMLVGGVLHMVGLVLYGRSQGAVKMLLWLVNGIVVASSIYYIVYFLIILPRTTFFVLPGTTPAEYWYPLFAEAGVRVFWIALSVVTLVVLGYGNERKEW